MSISSNPRGSSKELAGNPENAQIYQPTAKLQQFTTFLFYQTFIGLSLGPLMSKEG